MQTWAWQSPRRDRKVTGETAAVATRRLGGGQAWQRPTWSPLATASLHVGEGKSTCRGESEPALERTESRTVNATSGGFWARAVNSVHHCEEPRGWRRREGHRVSRLYSRQQTFPKAVCVGGNITGGWVEGEEAHGDDRIKAMLNWGGNLVQRGEGKNTGSKTSKN